ncbi:hypothetical protein EIP91_003794 [Steccherinum ochraceum]|uniref:DNA-directed RNA polymerase I subunit rpa34 n=1 Tax=Steccherinum ochraceum TaxID=92696 RepID=A0A4R0R9Y4_9APHY|nr:hypothetical protein EIP91_003794 [Steccherinum ochraceum]
MSAAVAGPSKTKATPKKPAHKKSTQKYKSKATIDDDEPEAPSSEPKNEGTNTGWAYEPPQGVTLADHDVDGEEFDYDALKGNEDLELWIVRVPDSIKPKHLESLQLDAPTSSVTGRMGSFEKRHVQYDVWNLGDDKDEHVGGEELKNLTCLLPRKRKGGKLYAAPASVATRHIVISAQPALPTPPQSSDAEESAPEPTETYANPPRYSYPIEAFKHRFMPLGSLAPTAEFFDPVDQDEATSGDMAIDSTIAIESVPVLQKTPKKDKSKKQKEQKTTKEESTPAKSRKRKSGDGASPKKLKKVKTEEAASED